MSTTTVEHGTVRSSSALLSMTQQQLDDLFAASPAGTIPTGRGAGLAIIAPRTFLGAAARHLIRWLIWKGKLFRPATGDLKNRLSPLGIPGIRAKVYVAASWKAPGEAIILDYSKTSFVARFIRDEIRQVGPGLYLGKVFFGRRHVFDFCLTFGQR